MRFPTYRVCPRLVVLGFRVEADVLHSGPEFGWNMKMVERSKYPLTKNDKIGSLADFFIYRKSPASGSGCIY